MKRTWITALIETFYTTLQHPEDLPALLNHFAFPLRFFFTLLLIPALGSTTALYFVRDYYPFAFYVEFGVLFLVHYAAFIVFSLTLGSLAHSFALQGRSDRSGSVWHTIEISMLSLLPATFATALAIPAKVSGHSILMIVPSILLLELWSLSIFYRAIRYHYQLDVKEALGVIFKSFGVMAIIPVSAFLLLILSIMELSA